MKAVHREAWRGYVCAALEGNLEPLFKMMKDLNAKLEGDQKPYTISQLVSILADQCLREETNRFNAPGTEVPE